MKTSRLISALAMTAWLAGCVSPAPGATPVPIGTLTPTLTAQPSPTATQTLTPTPLPYAYPMRLEEIGHIGGDAAALALSGDRLYVQTGLDHFIVVDVSNPYRPTQIGRSHRVESGISVIGAYKRTLLIGDNGGHLVAFDVTDDQSPTVIKTIDVGDRVEEMIVDGRYAYAAARTKGALIIDMGADGRPQVIGTAKVNGRARRVTKTGNNLVVGSINVSAQYGGVVPFGPDDPYPTIVPNEAVDQIMTVFDISDPAKPDQLSATLLQSCNLDVQGGIQALNQQIMFYFWGFRYDISDPKHPVRIDDYGFVPDAIAGKYAIRFNDCHDECPTHLNILDVVPIDLNDPYDGAYWTAIGPLPEHIITWQSRLVVDKKILYLADNDFLRIYDVSGTPFEVDQSRRHLPPYLDYPQIGALDMDAGTRPGGGGMYFWPQPFDLCGAYLYTGKGYWNLDDPAAPRLVGDNAPNARCSSDARTSGGEFSQPYDGRTISSEDERTLIPNGSGVLRFVDTSNPDQPRRTDVFFTKELGNLVGVYHNRLYYLALDDAKKPQHSILEVFDVSDATHPKLLGKSEPQPVFGQYDSAHLIGNLVVWNHYESSQMTMVLDATDPAHIQPGRGDADPAVVDPDRTIASGEYAYNGSQTRVEVFRLDQLSEPLTVLDLPEHPSPIYYGTDFQVFGDMLYAYGVIVDVSDPVRPKILALSNRTPYQIETYQGAIYFNLLDDGITIYRLAAN